MSLVSQSSHRTIASCLLCSDHACFFSSVRPLRRLLQPDAHWRHTCGAAPPQPQALPPVLPPAPICLDVSTDLPQAKPVAAYVHKTRFDSLSHTFHSVLLPFFFLTIPTPPHRAPPLPNPLSPPSQADRQRLCDEFNNDASAFCFLISTRVGVGLNLTSANKVVVFDPSWDPGKDQQAMDRAFRIGQERDVEVIRLVTSGTIEELVYTRQVRGVGVGAHPWARVAHTGVDLRRFRFALLRSAARLLCLVALPGRGSHCLPICGTRLKLSVAHSMQQTLTTLHASPLAPF